MKTLSLTIDGKKITAQRGEKLLWAALAQGIYIPNLCALRDNQEPAASCRLCFVEIEGHESPVTACTEPVSEGMVVNTKGEKALRLARTAFELLLASHQLDCGHCARHGSCELQKIAHHLGVRLKPKRFRHLASEFPVDNSCPSFSYNPNKCVLCGRCVWVCHNQGGEKVLGFAHRGFARVVTTFGDEPLGTSGCPKCGKCVALCPTGALVSRK